jgi:hypothetical protein
LVAPGGEVSGEGETEETAATGDDDFRGSHGGGYGVSLRGVV